MLLALNNKRNELLIQAENAQASDKSSDVTRLLHQSRATRVLVELIQSEEGFEKLVSNTQQTR